jgi:hypothetical protein
VQEKAATPPPTLPDTNVVPCQAWAKARSTTNLQCGASQTNERRSQAQHRADAFQSPLRR